MNLYTSLSPVATDSHARAAEATPVDFDPATHRIIARHFFGIAPLHPINTIAATVPASLRRHRQFEHIHRLGPRAVEELMLEVANGENLDRALAAYQQLTPELLEALGGDRFPAAPIYRCRNAGE